MESQLNHGNFGLRNSHSMPALRRRGLAAEQSAVNGLLALDRRPRLRAPRLIRDRF